jgi:hypothetical protein
VHDRPYDPPRDRIGDPARDWGRETGIVPWVFAGADVGVFLGGEWRTTRYGFRRHPYESRQAVRAGYATGLSAVRAEYEGLFYRTNSRTYVTIFGRGSGAELIRFHGFGNETPAEEPSDFYRVEQPQLVLAAALTRPAGDWRFWAGPLVKFSHTRLEPGQFITIVRPYGVGDFGQAGFTGGFQLDRRDHPRAATSGFLLRAEGSVYPPVWSVGETFGEVHGEAAAYLTPAAGPRPTLALRVGGKRVWGQFPFHEAAHVGGPDLVRGLRRQRYAGESAVFANAEVRIPVARINLLVPADVGVFGLVDTGRVFVEGESSDRWHTGAGAGLSIAFLKPENTVSFTVARSEGKTRLYAALGFVF